MGNHLQNPVYIQMGLEYLNELYFWGSVTLALEHRALAILAKKNANCLANSWLYFMNPN